jgi:YYY domain-containing protein
LKNSLTFVVVGGLAAIGSILTLYHLRERERSFTLLLGSVACALVAFCEIIFLRDVFVDQVPRMNTVFKFYFQAWALLSIVGGAGVYFVLDSLRPSMKLSPSSRWSYAASRVLWSVALLVFLLMGAVYPLTAVPQRYQGFTRDTSLDGLDYMKTSDPSDYAAIRWLNATVTGDPVIVEAPGGEYTLYGRVSIFTGLPSPINWQGHEWQWRVNWVNKGQNSADFFRRVTDVNHIYTDPSPQDVLSLMKLYHAHYLYVGSLEEQTYLSSGVSLQRFGSFMKIVYQNNGVTIYQVPSA